MCMLTSIEAYKFFFIEEKLSNLQIKQTSNLHNIWEYSISQIETKEEQDSQETMLKFEKFLNENKIEYVKQRNGYSTDKNFQRLNIVQNYSLLNEFILKKGRVFTKDDFYREVNLATLVPNEYQQYYKLGDLIDITLDDLNGKQQQKTIQIVGFIDTNKAFPLMNTQRFNFSDIFVADANAFSKLEETKWTMQVRPNDLKKLKHFENQLIESSYVSAKENKLRSINLFNQNINQQILFFGMKILVFIVFIYCVFINYAIRSFQLSRKENGIYLLCGANRNEVMNMLIMEINIYSVVGICLAFIYLGIWQQPFQYGISEEKIILNWNGIWKLLSMFFILQLGIYVFVRLKYRRIPEINYILKR
ncbi:ABC transporter permease [Listeria monocytogenes]|nr:ABC transporter permease [Listeria monocytogenes]